MNSSHNRRWGVEPWTLALAGVVIAAAAWLFVTKVSGKMPDLDVYLRAGARAAAGEPLYRAEDQHYQFKYLPAFAVLAIPVGALPLPLAKGVWFTASVALLVVLITLSIRLLPQQRKPTWLLVVSAIVVLANVGRILAGSDFPITVEGHTDNTPINTPLFPSNWELSVVRASSVVRLFIENGVEARLLTATGYADQRPVDDNATPSGRQRNRRVAITIESQVPDEGVAVPL